MKLEQHDVVRIDETAHEEGSQRFLVAGFSRAYRSSSHATVRSAYSPVADIARVGDIGAVGRPDPAAEAELAKRVGIEVRLHGLGKTVTITRVGRHRLAVLHEVGVADMPFAVVVGVVAAALNGADRDRPGAATACGCRRGVCRGRGQVTPCTSGTDR